MYKTVVLEIIVEKSNDSRTYNMYLEVRWWGDFLYTLSRHFYALCKYTYYISIRMVNTARTGLILKETVMFVIDWKTQHLKKSNIKMMSNAQKRATDQNKSL